MIRIINGKRYNTETAHEVLALALPRVDSRNDFRWEDTSLYLTKNGAWFLAGHGGPMSRWAWHSGTGTWGPGEGIKPICAQEAQDILEDYGQTELLEQYFPHKLQDA